MVMNELLELLNAERSLNESRYNEAINTHKNVIASKHKALIDFCDFLIKWANKKNEEPINDLISRAHAIKSIDDLPKCYNGFSDTYDKAYIIGVLEDLPPANPEMKCTRVIDEFVEFQIEWLTSHCDIEFIPEEENLIIGFLKDTGDSFKKEKERD